MVAKIVLVMCAISMVNGVLFLEKLQDKPPQFRSQEGCYIDQLNRVVPFGEVVRIPGKCIRVECTRFNIEYATCDVAATDDPKCHVEEGTGPHYPYCCPWIKCE